MAGVNKVILIGHLGKDPEIRVTQNSTECALFSLATSESWKDRTTQEKKTKTEWHQVVIFNENIVNIVKKYLHKGSKVYVEGQIRTRKWTDNSGNDRYTTEIVLSKYKGELGLLDSQSNRPPPPTNSNDYGYESSPPSAC